MPNIVALNEKVREPGTISIRACPTNYILSVQLQGTTSLTRSNEPQAKTQEKSGFRPRHFQDLLPCLSKCSDWPLISLGLLQLGTAATLDWGFEGLDHPQPRSTHEVMLFALDRPPDNVYKMVVSRRI